jgi:hypothetical protein
VKQLLIISSGPDKKKELNNLKSPVIFDNDFIIRKALNVTATPSAIEIDDNGVFSSNLVSGGLAVLSLVGTSMNKSLEEEQTLVKTKRVEK